VVELRTSRDVVDYVNSTGSHFFDPDTMRYWGTRVLEGLWSGPGGTWFCTSDKGYSGDGRRRVYSCRSVRTPAEVASGLALMGPGRESFPTAAAAKARAAWLARGGNLLEQL
jgi:hypothetical protein